MNLIELCDYPYQFSITHGALRNGIHLKLTFDDGTTRWGDVAPLPSWNQETLENIQKQLSHKKSKILDTVWTRTSCSNLIKELDLLPSLSFGLEAALLSRLFPITEEKVPVSALLMGSVDEIIAQAKLRKDEGFTSAKVKVKNLKPEDAFDLLKYLKSQFHLRVDINHAWEDKETLKFFSAFSYDDFDYVEDPIRDSSGLVNFPLPFALDKSHADLDQLKSNPNFKMLIYKPTVRGGLSNLQNIERWAKQSNVGVVLSSSFESEIGLLHVAELACRLSLPLQPVGIGTYHHMNKYFLINSNMFSEGHLDLKSIRQQAERLYLS